MNIKIRIVVMNFLQFFIWGSWLISLGAYLFNVLHFSGVQVGSIYGTMGLASLFMPALLGIVADRWINAERVLGLCHLLGAGLLIWASKVTDYPTLHTIMLLNCMVYMPTLALNNTVSYIILEQKGYNIVKAFPPIRFWGTIGFIAAMWVIDFAGWTKSPLQLYISAGAALLLGLYAFTMPACPPAKTQEKRGFISAMGLDAFVLFKNNKMLIFFIFSMLLGAALQITNALGGAYLDDFKSSYPDSFGVKHPNLLLSISQISETLFILAIPFFLQRFGIKKVMLISIFAWVFRFGLFAIGNPGSGLPLLVLSMIIYGMAFDFFNISGSLFVEKEANVNIRASAQGLFMLMTNGIGAFLGTWISGYAVDYFTTGGIKDWGKIWNSFALYALVLGMVFPFIFKYKHDPKAI
ncbi:MAG: nucleoside permease [Saprospiraceae bacterium]|jgi:NHS family xanthosine MFS transporter|nr:nucleoside permease [Saprospiraceae bacterium]MBK7436755.1 nucleoside permease [Saprospiraceae bacterium]MBK7608218.1 nucleoside permease [Saprospiraceae bacterium]MBK8279274.1 nucleoside permease [Saprospiraceae bacterium]MBK8511527.1 nucleoside permease [Saprospiraceae bacterium]